MNNTNAKECVSEEGKRKSIDCEDVKQQPKRSFIQLGQLGLNLLVVAPRAQPATAPYF